ncbi:hypothetical protein [Alicyclobacillus sp. SO9]|uniref:hypothetical protein n=1 Tax=Alicyclobacillus sp. SO9 TaxID=2665646 RepID=UPI0018E7DA19|nr:hypothetical protein [Alicyclobacillus sp. SO9]QQE77278.1 hypothetical protein GI364_15065 [Alicyclobacillus sp. SO9]
MLSFEHKREILRSFPELREESISNGRFVNFTFSGSKKPGRTVARELYHSGNGFVCGRYMEDYLTDARGWINIKNFKEAELREVVSRSIASMSKP